MTTNPSNTCTYPILLFCPSKNDPFGRELTQDIAAIFQRQQEERVQPVGKDDVAEVLRRRLFTPGSIQDRTKFSPQVVAALKGIANLEEQTNKEKNLAEQRFLQSYPFHPDLTEIFYTKWTQLEGAKNCNVIVLSVPDRNGLDAAKSDMRKYLGWLEVQDLLKNQEIDASRQKRLKDNLEESRQKIPGSVEQAYCIVVTVAENNDIQAFKINVGSEPLFNLIKAEPKSRIQETPIPPDAIIPGGAYDLWRQDEQSRFVNNLVGAFTQRSNLPKMLNSKSILDTLINGCIEGTFVLRLMRPDRSFKTF